MTVTEFHRAVIAALATDPDEFVLKELGKHAQQLADMVGWSVGIIDQDGSVLDAFQKLQASARSKHEATGDQYVAALHDSIGLLLDAIYQHDEDLKPSIDSDDDIVTPQA